MRIISGKITYTKSDLLFEAKKYIEKYNLSKDGGVLFCSSNRKIDYCILYEAAIILSVQFCPLPFNKDEKITRLLAENIKEAGVLVTEKSSHKINESLSKRNVIGRDIKLIFLTSGSSGRRKLVALNSLNIQSALESIQERLGYKNSDVISNMLPMSFDYGFYQYLLAKKSSATLILVDEGYSLIGLKSVINSKATILPGVPSMLANIANKASRLLSKNSIRLITSTGESIRKNLIEDLENAFPEATIAPMYGLTECKRVSINADSKGKAKHSVGKPISCCAVEINNPDSRGVGEIIVKGSNVAESIYYITDKGLEEIIKNGNVLKTGDFGWFNSDGYLYIEGRKDDLVKMSGIRVSLREIEDYIYANKLAKNVKAVLINEVVKLYCVDANLNEAELKMKMIDDLGHHMNTVDIKFIRDFALSDNLKFSMESL
ncbi:class I adenylate-forming enzyme family protein [Vibrio splendidus]